MIRSRMRTWLETTAITNPVERGQSVVFQIMLLGIGAFGLFLIGLLLIALITTSGGAAERSTILAFLVLVLFLIACVTASVLVLRRGRFQAAVILVAVGFTILHGITVISLGIANREVLLVYILPLILAGLLSSRRALPAVLLLAVGAVWIAALREPALPPPSDGIPRLSDPSAPAAVAFNFTLLIGIGGSFFLFFGNVLSDALSRALAREHELEALRRSLEQTVDARTTELRTALSDVESRAAVQATLLAENKEQREVIREMSVPLLPVSDTTLVMPLVGALDSRRMLDAQEQALTRIERTRARRLILDITGVPVVDTQVAQGLVQMVQSIKLLGADAVLVGIRPEVAQTIVGLGLMLETIRTASDVQSALAMGRK